MMVMSTSLASTEPSLTPRIGGESNKTRSYCDFSFAMRSVMRWEFRPGSTLFLVWAHGRQNDERPYSDRSWMYDYRDLFDLRPDNTLLVKVAYWLNR